MSKLVTFKITSFMINEEMGHAPSAADVVDFINANLPVSKVFQIIPDFSHNSWDVVLKTESYTDYVNIRAILKLKNPDLSLHIPELTFGEYLKGWGGDVNSTMGN